MLLYEKIIIEEEHLSVLKNLVETYKTIAISTARRVRTSVLENRAFHFGLDKWFQGVKRAYEAEAGKKSRKNSSPAFITRNGKTIFVLLSANTGLYGDILRNIFDVFGGELRKNKADVAIAGRIGTKFFEEKFPGRTFKYFDLPDNVVPAEKIHEITEYLRHYEKVVVFHGRFKNIIMQEAATSVVTGDMPEFSAAAPLVKFLFEPSIEAVARFFETEIFSSLLGQVFHESRLAKVTSRMLLLDKADQNIIEAQKNTKFLKNQIYHQAENKRQVNLTVALTQSYIL